MIANALGEIQAKEDFCFENGFDIYEKNKCYKVNENSVVLVKNIFCENKKCYFTEEEK